MIILGIDPGFAITGYGIIERKSNNYRVVDFGVITTEPSIELPQRLYHLYERLNEIIEQYRPDAFAIEELFFCKNIRTAINVAHARGVAIMCASKAGLKTFEYTPLQVKQAIAGYGRAEKRQIQEMTRIMLNMREIPKPDDAADALAVAICHANTNRKLTGIDN